MGSSGNGMFGTYRGGGAGSTACPVEGTSL